MPYRPSLSQIRANGPCSGVEAPVPGPTSRTGQPTLPRAENSESDPKWDETTDESSNRAVGA